MKVKDLNRRLVAEAIGTAMLLIAVVGSGIMAERLAAGNVAVALLCNAIATGAALYVLITVLGPVSGAHLNPAVTMAMWASNQIESPAALFYVPVQFAAGLVGVIAAHAMFDLPLLQVSPTVRSGTGQWLAEVIATFGLVLTIFGAVRFDPSKVAAAVGLYILGAYWFTASTSFANPAVTLARCFTATFAGIAPGDAPAFIVAEIVGALLALAVAGWLFRKKLD